MTDYNTPQLVPAEYIVQFSDGNATVLCDTHMTALRMAAAAALQPVDIYQLPDDEDAHCVSGLSPSRNAAPAHSFAPLTGLNWCRKTLWLNKQQGLQTSC
jgi:hypothetical protein